MNYAKMRRVLKLASMQLNLNVSDYEIDNIIYKLAGEFEDAVKDKKFKNPETGNQVKFQSLPAEQQSKIRSQYNKSQEKAKGKGGGREKDMGDKFNSDPKFRAEVVDKTIKAISGEEVKKQLAESVKSEIKKKDLDNFTESLKDGDAKKFEKSMGDVSKGVMKGVLKTLGVVLGGAALLALGGHAISGAVTGVMDDIKNQRVEELEEEMDEMYDGMEDELDDVLSEYDEDDPQKEMFEALMGEAKGKLNSQGSIIESTPGGIYYFDAFHGSSWNPHDVFDKTLELIEEKHTQFGFSEKDIELMEEEKDLFQNMFSRSTAEEKFTNEDREISNELKDIQNKINKVLESQREFTQEVVEKANTQYANSLEPSEGEKYNDMVTKMEKFRELDPHLQMTDDLIEIFDKDIRENVNTQSEIGSKMHEEVGAEIRESQDRAKEIGAEVGKLTEKWYDLAEKKDLNLAEMKSLQNKMDAITREVAREAEDESEYKKLNEYVRKYEKNLDTYNKEIGKLDDEIIARNEQISKLVDEIEKVDDKSKIQKMNEIQSLESKNQKSIESRTDLVDKREDMNSKREDYAARKEEITQKYYEDLQDDEKEAFEKLKKEYDSLQEKDTKFKSEMEKNQKDRDDLDNESAENEKKGQKKLKEFHKLEDEYANYGDLEEESRNLRLDIRKDVGDYSKEVSNLLKKANMAKFSKEDKMNINMIVGLVQEKLKEKIKDLKKNPPKSNTTNKKAKEKKSLDKDKLVATIQKNLIKNLKAMKK